MKNREHLLLVTENYALGWIKIAEYMAETKDFSGAEKDGLMSEVLNKLNTKNKDH